MVQVYRSASSGAGDRSSRASAGGQMSTSSGLVGEGGNHSGVVWRGGPGPRFEVYGGSNSAFIPGRDSSRTNEACYGCDAGRSGGCCARCARGVFRGVSGVSSACLEGQYSIVSFEGRAKRVVVRASNGGYARYGPGRCSQSPWDALRNAGGESGANGIGWLRGRWLPLQRGSVVCSIVSSSDEDFSIIEYRYILGRLSVGGVSTGGWHWAGGGAGRAGASEGRGY